MQVPAFADGRIDPGGPTLAKLNALASAPGPVPTPAAPKGSSTDVARARGIAQTWLTTVEPSITGFIFSICKKSSPRRRRRCAARLHRGRLPQAFQAHPGCLEEGDSAHPNTKVFNPATNKTFLPTIRANFRAIQGVVIDQFKFDLITAATAVADKAPGIAAYVKATGGNIQVSPAFNSPTRGPRLRVRYRHP